MSKPRLATVWLDGCSGCHMSFLDLDEKLLDVLKLADLVYSPLVDTKQYPDEVDVVLVEGAVSSDEDLAKLLKVRKHTKVLVAFGDCAVTSNVPAMRNRWSPEEIEKQIYVDNVQQNPGVPSRVVPKLLPQSRPIHEFVKVDVFVPGCPPSAETILFVVSEILAGRTPDLAGKTHFGA
ncbi:MAG: NADP oxidoreductase [Verrucomicrobiota bacterium]